MLLPVVGFGILVTSVSVNTILQTIGGLCCVAAALVLARKRHDIRAGIRPIYEKLGITRR